MNERPLPKPRIPSLLRNLAGELHILDLGKLKMDALLIAGAVAGSFAGALILQRAALEGLLRVMAPGRRSHS